MFFPIKFWEASSDFDSLINGVAMKELFSYFLTNEMANKGC